MTPTELKYFRLATKYEKALVRIATFNPLERDIFGSLGGYMHPKIARQALGKRICNRELKKEGY